MKGLAPHTERIFEPVSRLDCIKPFTLVGGTALALQIGARQSEDLDFMTWRTTKSEKREVEWNRIERELATVGEIESMNLMGFDHVEFVVDGVKLSFYASEKYSPVREPVKQMGNIKLADTVSIGAMKMEVMLRRATFRDYYDIYAILRSGVALGEIIPLALEYSQHRLKTKNLLAMLTNGAHFMRDAHFQQLAPVYDVTAQEIEEYIRERLQELNG